MLRLGVSILCLLFSFQTQASHIVGGEIYYDHIGGSSYKVTLIVYQDCNSSANVTSPSIVAYPLDGGSSISSVGSNVFDGFVSTTYIPNPCLQAPASVCLRKKVFETTMNLPSGTNGYDLAFEDFARSANIDNFLTPDQWSSIYYTVVPDVNPPNNGPRFPNDPPPNLCLNDTFRYDHSVIDPDGDSIVYKWCNPKGNFGASVGAGSPYPNVSWCCGYGTNNPVPSTPPFTLDPQTGLMEGIPNTNGNYVYSVCYEEYRNGVKINEGARDYMFRITNCSPRNPSVNTVAQGGASNLGYCSDMTVDFQNTSTDAETYYWDFGDTLITTDTSTLKEPTYTYNQAGVYTIMLVANPGTSCADTMYIDYEIYPEVDIFYVPPAPVCFEGGLFDFETLGQFDSTDTFEWDFGPLAVEQFSNEQNPDSVMFTEPGFHTVTLTVSNAVCSSTYTDIVEVLDSPDPFFDQPDDQCIDNNNYTFVAKGDFGPGSQILWVLGDDANRDSLSSPTAANIVYSDTGMHIVSLFISENGCTIEHRDTFFIVQPPTASFPDLSAKQCLNINSYDFWPDGEFSPTAEFQWDFGNMATVNSATTDSVFGVSWYAPGIYTVTLTIDDGGCVDVYQGNVEIVEAPQAFAFDEAPQCINGNSFDFDGSGLYGPSASFMWVFPDANKDTTYNEDEPNVIFQDTGIHRVYFTITENGCPDTYFLDVEVTAEPIAQFDTVPNQCISNGPFDFMFSGYGGKYATYQWNLPGDATIQSDSNLNSISIPEVDFGTPGVKTVTLTVSENGCTETFTHTFTLTPAPTASFDPHTPQCLSVNSFDFNNTGTYGSGAIINWDFGDATPSTSTDEHPSNIIFNTAGSHAVTLSITEFGCTDIYTDTILVTPPPAPMFTTGGPQCVDSNSFNFANLGSYTNAATFSWTFQNGLPGTSTDENPNNIQFMAPGKHLVTLTIDEYGCSVSYTDTVTITPAPVPFFDHKPAGCVSQNLYDFSAGGSFGPNAVFTWDFGSNSNQGTGIVNAQDVYSVNFTTVGVHYILLSIEENGCTYSYQDSVIITSDPQPYINPVNDQCVNINAYDFSPAGSVYGDSAQFYWDFGTAASYRYDSTLSPPTVTFTSDGTHEVIFTIEENGCSVSDTLLVTVTPPPGATFALDGVNQEQCININTYDFITTGVYGPTATFDWTFNNGTPATSTVSNPTNIVFSNIGWNTVSLTVTENGCPETHIDSILITDVPTAFTAQVDTQCVNNNSYDFYGGGTFGPNATFEWDFDGAAIPNTVNSLNALFVTFNQVGQHDVTFTVTENGCSDTYTIPVHITPAPDATFTVNDIDQCVTNHSFDFFITSLSQYGPNATFNWDFGTSATPNNFNGPSPTGVTFSDTGYYPVSVTISENGCTDTYQLTVAVYPEPEPEFTANQTGCFPHTVNFTDNSYAWTNLSYFWDFGDGNTSTLQNPSHTYPSPGNYTVSLTVTVAGSDPCPGDYTETKTDFITVYPSPTSDFEVDRYKTDIFDPIITVSDLSQDAVTVSFDFGDGTVVNDTAGSSHSHAYTSHGFYDITLITTNQYGCQDTVVKTVEIESIFRFYPPNAFSPNGDNSNDVYIQKGIGFEDGSYELRIYTRWGEEIYFTDNHQLGWNGFNNKTNSMAAVGQYIYKTIIVDNYGIVHKYVGDVNVIR